MAPAAQKHVHVVASVYICYDIRQRHIHGQRHNHRQGGARSLCALWALEGLLS